MCSSDTLKTGTSKSCWLPQFNFFFSFLITSFIFILPYPNLLTPWWVGGGDFRVNFHLWFPTLWKSECIIISPISLADLVPLKGSVRLSQMQFCGALPSLRQEPSGWITPSAGMQQLAPKPVPASTHPAIFVWLLATSWHFGRCSPPFAFSLDAWYTFQQLMPLDLIYLTFKAF